MIDLIAAILLAFIFAIIVGALAALVPASRGARLALLSGGALWMGIVLAAAALGGFAQGATGPVPGVAYAFSAPLAVGLAAWSLAPRFRGALLAVPLPALIALHAGRLFGAFFVLLYAQERLPAPFAPVAGWGDVAVGGLAIPIAALAARNAVRSHWIGLWNAVGALDLVMAVSLALLSVPGTPFRVFMDGPGAADTMGTLPWVVIPTALVPIYLMLHWTIAWKLTLSLRAVRTVKAAA